MKAAETLKLDTKYYLSQQIHPVVTRLCEPIEGIDAYHIAEALGLDPTGFKHKSSSSGNTLTIAPPQLSKQQKKLESFMNELEKYTNCVPFKYICPDCKTEQKWQSPFIKLNPNETSNSKPATNAKVKQEPFTNIGNIDIKMEKDDDDIDIDLDGVITTKKTAAAANSNFKCILDACSNASCKLRPLAKVNYIKNQITLQLAKFIKQYYQVRVLLIFSCDFIYLEKFLG